MTYEEYLKQREIMVAENANLVGNVLNPAELELDNLLSEYKKEIRESVDERHLYSMPVLRNETFWNSKLWQFTKALPKGSDLHVHGTALIPAWKLIDFVCTRPELVVDIRDGHIYNIEESFDKAYCYNLKDALDKGVISRKDIESKWCLLGLKHEENVWDYFEELFVKQESIEYSYETYYAYYLYAFNYYVSNNIMHIEIHALFSEDYERTKAYVNEVKKAYFEVKKDHPEFVVSLICSSLKYNGIDLEIPKKYYSNARKIKEEIKDDFDPENIHEFVIGFDLFNEEDSSLSLEKIAPMLIEGRKKYPDIKLILHCGESLRAQSNNLIDAYLLGAERVGHGMNLYRYPKLLQQYADKEICLESCLISNQSLRYVKDLRLHPSFEYLRRGVVISLCSDDPAYQEKEALCDDFFAAIMCWDLNLADVKQLCINSIMYSGVDENQKKTMTINWKKKWNEFVQGYNISEDSH